MGWWEMEMGEARCENEEVGLFLCCWCRLRNMLSSSSLKEDAGREEIPCRDDPIRESPVRVVCGVGGWVLCVCDEWNRVRVHACAWAVGQ